ncbi:endonuclease III [Gammaproteobacteria bacterium]|nr:endonuclease III [Gammaproteobacteria bacterium]|tara:strand:+ start:911 stop:1555 length:645 start_codon:yes stop_codon:yes gene_type:complete
MDTKVATEIFKVFTKINPEPTTELKYKNNFELLISVILSAQATDVSVNKATKHLFKIANNPKSILQLGLTGLKQEIRTIGLYNNKAKNIIKTCEYLISKHKGRVPKDREALEQLPGVGRKTANVILNTAFSKPTIAVDTHVFRVANRTGLAKGETPIKVEHGLLSVIPKKYLINAHHHLILHGRYVCLARKPLCYKCHIANHCAFKEKTCEPNR